MGRARPTPHPGPTVARIVAAGCLLVLVAGCTAPSGGATSPGGTAGSAPAPLSSSGQPSAAVPSVSVPASPTPEVPALAAGATSACLLDSNAGLTCWGAGIVGDGTITPQNVPRHVVGLTSGVTSVGIGRQHACVLAHGSVQCWGTNEEGPVGDGTTVPRVVAVPVPGLATGVSAVVAGSDHSCALTTEGGVKCWGRNAEGQLGDGTTTNRSRPTDVVGLASGVTRLAAGDEHTCAVTEVGGVVCWGLNSSGQLGDGTTRNRAEPVAVRGLDSGATLVAASTQNTCAVTTAGGLLCWGDNEHGQVGDGTTTVRHTPVPVARLSSGVDGVTLGTGHACARTDAGAALCWGDNAKGQLGDGTTVHRTRPTPVKGLDSGVHEIAAGWTHSCAIAAEGTAVCWGGNNMGQLGDGMAARVRLAPHPVTPAATAAPYWKRQFDDFEAGSTPNWWTGCDRTGCTSAKKGVYTIKPKKPLYWLFQVFESDQRLRAVSMTFDLKKLTTRAAESSIGLACMVAGDPGEETSYYDLRLRDDGGLSFAKYSKGTWSTVAEWPAPGTSSDPVRAVSFGCESVEGRVFLAGRVAGHFYEMADRTEPLPPGRAAMTVGQRGKGNSVTVVNAIEVVAELAAA